MSKRGKRKSKKEQRQAVIDSDPCCVYCGKEVGIHNSCLYREKRHKPKVLACVECVYIRRQELRFLKKHCSERVRLLDENPRCHYCNRQVSLLNSTLDHVVPRCKGGKKCVLACVICNHRKKDMSESDFMALLSEKVACNA